MEIAGRVVAKPGCTQAGILLREAAARPARPAAESMRASVPMPPDPLLGWRNLPGYIGDNLGAPVRHNALGLRGPEVPVEKPPGTLRVLLLGDSTIYGHGVEEAATFGRVLEARLQARLPEARLEVIDAGVPAYSSLQSLRQLRYVLADTSPDVIVIGNMWSDSMPADAPDDTWLLGDAWRERSLRIDEQLSAVSAAWCAVKPARAATREQQNAFARVAQPGRATPDLPSRRVPLEAYQQNLETMAGWARAHGAAPVFLALGHPSDRVNGLVGIGPRHRENIESYRARMRGAAVAQRAPLAEAASAYGKARALGQNELFLDSIHPTPEGHALVADVLESTMLGSEEVRRVLGLPAERP
jgi:lysophospholipase L1-like esterase